MASPAKPRNPAQPRVEVKGLRVHLDTQTRQPQDALDGFNSSRIARSSIETSAATPCPWFWMTRRLPRNSTWRSASRKRMRISVTPMGCDSVLPVLFTFLPMGISSSSPSRMACYVILYVILYAMPGGGLPCAKS